MSKNLINESEELNTIKHNSHINIIVKASFLIMLFMLGLPFLSYLFVADIIYDIKDYHMEITEGDSLYKKGRYKEAINKYRFVLFFDRSGRTHIFAKQGLIFSYNKIGDKKKAKKYFQSYVKERYEYYSKYGSEMFGNYESDMMILYLSYLKDGKIDQARTIMRQSINEPERDRQPSAELEELSNMTDLLYTK